MWTKEKTLAVIGILAVIVLSIASYLTAKNYKPSQSTTATAPANTTPVGDLPLTREPVPPNVTVPNEGSTTAAGNIAIPEIQTNAHHKGTASYRQFALNANGNAFTPSTVIANKDDIIDLEITAVDKDYEFTQPDYGFNVAIPEGTTKKIQFEALSAGKFSFYCASCGGPSVGPVGSLIITQD